MREGLREKLDNWESVAEPLLSALRNSGKLTAEDYAVTINARAEDVGQEEK